MEGIVILFFLVPILLIVFLLSDPFKRQREAKANREWDRWVKPYKDKELPSDYLKPKYKSPEEMGYIRGERGGTYEIRISKRTGKPYRHYF